ncbi:M61 family metallopeptidase [Sphingomonas sp. PAMC 26621]|uniref:M61 family metallopeptidase n=1 Tax=Sphingomonas sp. PAMC 26621 TaxID=1112213 RepID=UPI0002EAF2C9|nr:M61 family metallopeptidase [Sphingomonas sp. PAMC 26621]
MLRLSSIARLSLLMVAPFVSASAVAQDSSATTGTSKPTQTLPTDSIPPPRDLPYPGSLKIAVDATDVAHGVFRVSETIPVKAGPIVLLYPQWLPGAHAPQGQIDKVAGLTFHAGNRILAWRRDQTDMYAFHVDVPTGVSEINVTFDFVSATDADQGQVVTSPNLLGLEWISTMLYPAGHYVRQIVVEPSATFPAGWTAATALRPVQPATGGTIHYKPVALDTLADSPVFAGRFARSEQLSPDVTLNMVADRPDQLAIAPAQLALERAMVDQATKLYGAQHYSHYDFLVALSDRVLTGVGLEHHRSSEDQMAPDSFLNWNDGVAERDLLAHEYTHSWNGKFRRPADLWTPDYRTPMRNSLLWVYEGQTQFWGKVLTARAGLISRDDAYDSLAQTAAAYAAQVGRNWRPLVDTTNEEILSNRRPEPFPSYQRDEAYYEEGQLIWLDADSLIREKSGGKRSLDNFAKAFFGVRDRDWGELTYTFEDVVTALNKVQPYDWAGFLHARVDERTPQPPLDGLARGGYALTYSDQPGRVWTAREKASETLDLSYSLGLRIGKDGAVTGVIWNGPAFAAGLSVGSKITAVDGDAYDDDGLKAAITRAKNDGKPITLLIKQGKTYRTVAVTWTGGLRYPHLVRTGKGPSTLDALYRSRG